MIIYYQDYRKRTYTLFGISFFYFNNLSIDNL